jgi:hypothetical protein
MQWVHIRKHRLFIDFKAAYDTIIRNEVYVGMSELNFPTKLIRLTKATLTIVTCCVKIQNDCSKPFENRQGLRQGDVLSTWLFNVVMEAIVWRANLQTTGTIYNKESKLLVYADDINIVGRSQSAVRDAYLALKIEAAKLGLKISEQKTKYMIAARNYWQLASGNWRPTLWSCQRICVSKIPDDTNEWRESGNTTKNPVCN